MNHPVIGVVTKADLASMEQISLVKSWLREAGAHNVLVTSAVNNNGVTELFAGNDSNLLIVFYVQIMPDDFVMQLHRF
ncbi:EutP/PduV family microcompartment system protein [Escherichia coli]|uniref:EutP/PduV family microcompartment system protein n=2 Tax=Escherichia coli TaxID=562 RepID=UPI00293165B6|nr:EutP/PduV family microcompartment system protein [Escherichia coli]